MEERLEERLAQWDAEPNRSMFISWRCAESDFANLDFGLLIGRVGKKYQQGGHIAGPLKGGMILVQKGLAHISFSRKD